MLLLLHVSRQPETIASLCLHRRAVYVHVLVCGLGVLLLCYVLRICMDVTLASTITVCAII